MAETNPFNFQDAPIVPPIPCTQCGNNMVCARRSPEQGGERQRFLCSCGNTSERIAGVELSDEEVQSLAEHLTGKANAKR